MTAKIYGSPHKNLIITRIGLVMDVLFVCPSSSLQAYQALSTLYAAIEPPTSKANHWELPSTFEGWAFLSYEALPLRTKYLSASEVLKFRDQAWQTYFTNPKYLELIEKRFGLQERHNVEDMSKIKLKRKILGD